jgi:hypothetical protein
MITRALRILLLLVLVPLACTNTRITRIQDPDYVGAGFSFPAVYADIVDLGQRQLVEEAMVAELDRAGVRARATIHLVPPTREYVPEERLDILRRTGIDALIVIAAESGVTLHYVPPSSTTSTQGSLQLRVVTTDYGSTAYSQASGTYRETSHTQHQGGHYVQKPWAKGAPAASTAPGASAPEPTATAPAAPSDLATRFEGCLLVGDDAQSLGRITSDATPADSILNPSGRHGSETSPLSVFNRRSPYAPAVDPRLLFAVLRQAGAP